jgi:hypothetical protein
MDPDATLQAIRELVENNDGSPEALALAENFRSLDEWLSRGGFLPTDWNALRSPLKG